MTDTKLRARKATSLLKDDHRKVKKLFADFDKLEKGDEAEMARIFTELKKEITLHARIEEEIFYPAVVKAEDDEAEERVLEALEEHRLVKMLIDELSGMSSDDELFRAKLKVLKDNVLHHAEEEESEAFELFDKLEKAERDRVSEELSNRKDELASED